MRLRKFEDLLFCAFLLLWLLVCILFFFALHLYYVIGFFAGGLSLGYYGRGFVQRHLP